MSLYFKKCWNLKKIINKIITSIIFVRQYNIILSVCAATHVNDIVIIYKLSLL